jgi:hypothetical protein
MSNTDLLHPAVDNRAPALRRRRSRLVGILVLMAALFGLVLTTAGPASAASRGFTLTNNSTSTLRLESATKVHHVLCVSGHCVHGVAYPMEFEGRPHDGTEIRPGGTQTWELKYGFNLVNLNEVQYAAKLTYKIEHTNGKVEYTIETTPTANNSTCVVIPASDGACTAEGLTLTFSNR